MKIAAPILPTPTTPPTTPPAIVAVIVDEPLFRSNWQARSHFINLVCYGRSHRAGDIGLDPIIIHQRRADSGYHLAL